MGRQDPRDHDPLGHRGPGDRQGLPALGPQARAGRLVRPEFRAPGKHSPGPLAAAPPSAGSAEVRLVHPAWAHPSEGLAVDPPEVPLGAPPAVAVLVSAPSGVEEW